MLHNLTGWHAVIILFVILLIFGAPKLPQLARSLGQSMHILKKEVRSPAADEAEDAAEEAAGPAATQHPVGAARRAGDAQV
ncbi:twin-arginine translocase TatA/TatE family subunit [Agromyces italicus]|uniref:twin-arginine translocase TatA/TatE family subunit n=1 Tax=Agromyces italicus TaxID=279572 RepID=UPI0003B34A5D|nr:twin-arginine translocase TatA/TatE family subunit [Agromyces italicus]